MPTAIYTNLISQMSAILATCTKVSKVYNYPISKLEGYPAVVVLPTACENEFNTSGNNYKNYKFSMSIICGAKQTTTKELFTKVLPNVVDEVLEAFDKGWSLTAVGGHRAWIKINSGNWGASEEQDGLEAWAEFEIEIKLLTNTN